jgi:hypothetical protein
MPWIFVIGNLASAEWILANCKMAFNPGVNYTLIEEGDPFVIYGSVMTFKRQVERYPQIVATGTVTATPATESIDVTGKIYLASCGLQFEMQAPLGRGAPFRPLVQKLSFIQNKQAWSVYFRRALKRVPDEDFAVIEGALAAHLERLSQAGESLDG